MTAATGRAWVQELLAGAPIVGETEGRQPIIAPDWIHTNIVEVHLCHHRVWVHKLIAQEVREASTWLRQDDLGGELRRVDSFNVRWIRGHHGVLSYHAVGLALDVNPEENPMGSPVCRIHPEVVAILKRKGFEHGADWVHPDVMHFQWKGY